MINREIPFRPRLEGDFRIRFYNAASAITSDMVYTNIIDIANNEINWVENECFINIEQRKKYRAIWFLFRDLIRASWKACYRDGVLYMTSPTLNYSGKNNSSPEAKSLLRAWMSESRHERLLTYTDFINRMENKDNGKASIIDLIADGKELEERLRKARDGKLHVNEAVKPYLQLVQENEKDKYTGLKLSEIWRYFRLTWSTPAETTPGRTMLYLIRDAAHPMHAVMGIASLENCAVQITCRDNFIGWNQGAFIEKLLKLNDKEAKKELKKLLCYLEDGIHGIDYSAICNEDDIKNPTENIIQKLLDLATDAEKARERILKDLATNELENEEMSDLGSIPESAVGALFRRKRADQLARLLSAKRTIGNIVNDRKFKDIWRAFCQSENGNYAIRRALLAQKAKHIGSSMMELNVCGAIPPYNEILAGKLVALLAISPQVIHDYKERYKNKPSEIASRLKGDAVCRPAELVYIGTTSLYYVGSSQYNRLKIPKEIFNSGFDVQWKEIGTTLGFGTLHISKATTLSLMEATSNEGFRKINHVFGEGASPKMRLLTTAIRQLLETPNEDLGEFSKHAMSRIVYGSCLAENTFDYLLGNDRKPNYYAKISDFIQNTNKIVNFWLERWLTSRLNFEPIYERIKNFNRENFMVSKQLGSEEKWKFSMLKEEYSMPVSEVKKENIKFLRDFYRGSSAYADYVDEDNLSRIHLKTRLDEAVIDAIAKGKDVVLTGNPGDGKTHIIRVLKEKIYQINKKSEIILDASTLANKEIYQIWKKAHDKRVPFVIAINAAVLYSVYQQFKKFSPIEMAYHQMSHAIVFREGQEQEEDVIVYDLSKREVLTADILEQAIIKFTDKQQYEECKNCPLISKCEVHKNCELLNKKIFQERLFLVLQRVSLNGYHATLRELQGFISYLIFGNRSCRDMAASIGDDQYNLVNLIYSGRGTLFDEIRNAIDPVNISHPIWDEKILANAISADTWTDGYQIQAEALAYDNDAMFSLRKRQFYFFNKDGIELFNIMNDDTTKYQKFLHQDDGKIVKELIRKLNIFFGVSNQSTSELQIWTGHRYDNEPRKVLISLGTLKKNSLTIGRPQLRKSMTDGIDTTANYIRLEKKEDTSIFLKIDFSLYILLESAERGVPVLFMESDLVKKVWRFIEQLQFSEKIDEDDIEITLLDIQNKKKLTVGIDREENKYSTIIGTKIKEL